MSSEKPSPPKPAANDENTELAKLKGLLLGDEQSSILKLESERDDAQLQTGRLANILPDALSRSYADDPNTLSQALDRPVAECMKGSVRRDPGFFADILYPVMGPAIRRSISEALKGLVQQINQTLEHSLTAKGLKWRFEAARSGVPFAEIVLRKTLQYRVEEVFLIQNGSGLLIQHLGRVDSPDANRESDADATSAMLTAIRDFARDTFDRDSGNESRLETIDAGDHTLWLIHGPKAYLACAIRGVAPIGLRDDLNAVLERIHRQYDDTLKSFDGDPSEAAPLQPLLEPCLHSVVSEEKTRRRPWPLLIIGTALIAALAWWLFNGWQAQQTKKQLVELQQHALTQLRASPGTVVTEWRLDDGRLAVSGLHDPMTESPASVLHGAGLDDNQFLTDFQSFQSTTSEAAIRRARQRLAPPDTIRLTLGDDNTLIAAGVADDAWRERARLLALTVPGVEYYDDSVVVDPDQLLRRQVIEQLAPPKGIEIQVQDGIARFAGDAPMAWIQGLNDALAGISLSAIDDRGLVPMENRRLERLTNMIGKTRILFDNGTKLDPLQLQKIENLAVLLNEAGDHATRLGREISLRIIGRTDGTGSPEQNHFVARKRAETIAQLLRDSGLAMPGFVLDTRIRRNVESDEADSLLRRVEFQVLGLGDVKTGITR